MFVMKTLFTSYRPFLLSLLCSILVLLWVYTAASKLADMPEFKRQLGNQTLGRPMAAFLLWFIPLSEIAATLLLLPRKTRLAGFVLSAFLLLLFSGYIALVLLGYYDRVPCSCGGVLKQLSWGPHLVFNLFFLLAAMAGVWLEKIARKP